VREVLDTKQITVLEHPAYSPDLALNGFILFLKINETLKERHFDDIDDIRNNTTAAGRPFHETNSKIVLKGGLGLASVHSFPRGVL
jgi:hypothetical protein